MRRGARRTPRRSRDPGLAAEPFAPLRRAYAPVDVLSPEAEARVHALSLSLLAETGLKFLSPDTWPILAGRGVHGGPRRRAWRASRPR